MNIYMQIAVSPLYLYQQERWQYSNTYVSGKENIFHTNYVLLPSVDYLSVSLYYFLYGFKTLNTVIIREITVL